MRIQSRKQARVHRHKRIRKTVRGTADCPRLSIMISNSSMYAQMIDDREGRTLVAATSGKDERVTVAGAEALGKRLGAAASEKGLKRFVVDRGGFRFHGRVRAIVDGVLASGLTNGKEAK